MVRHYWFVGVAVLLGCQERDSPTPVLPAATLAFQDPPSARPGAREVPLLLPPGGQWTLRFEYAASQRRPGAPDLDVQASGSATVRGTEAHVFDVDVTVRPEAPAWSEMVKSAVAQLPQRLTSLPWRAVGDSDGGIRLDGSMDGVSAWAIADGLGVKDAHARFEVTARRDDGAQASRLTVRVERR